MRTIGDLESFLRTNKIELSDVSYSRRAWHVSVSFDRGYRYGEGKGSTLEAAIEAALQDAGWEG